MTTWDSSPNARPVPTAESSVSEVRDYFFNYRPAEIWNETLQTNVAAVFTTSMAFLELLDAGNKRREKGKPTSQIISIGSVGGLTRFTPSYIYNASKAAVHHLMKNLGATFVPFDIRTNVIAPGCKHLHHRHYFHFHKELLLTTPRVPIRHDNTRRQKLGTHPRRHATHPRPATTHGHRRGNGRHDLVSCVQGWRLLQWQYHVD